jgi:hypothetical protein
VLLQQVSYTNVYIASDNSEHDHLKLPKQYRLHNKRQAINIPVYMSHICLSAVCVTGKKQVIYRLELLNSVPVRDIEI